jgi:selenocysteine-specific elongation factor
VDAHHDRWPLRPGMELEELRRSVPAAAPLTQNVLDELVAAASLENRDGRIARAGYRPPADPHRDARVAAVLDLLERSGPEPPAEGELFAAAGAGTDPPDELLRYMENAGLVVRLQPGVYLHRHVIDRLTAAVREGLGGRSGLGPADFRPIVDVSRKHLIPILEYLDGMGVTVRHGDGRAVPAGAAKA